MKNQKMLPGEIAAAVTTRRPELLTSLRHKVSREGLPADDAVALIDLVGDAIREAVADDERRRVLVTRVKDLRATVKGTLTALDRLVAEFEGRSADDNEEEDEG